MGLAETVHLTWVEISIGRSSIYGENGMRSYYRRSNVRDSEGKNPSFWYKGIRVHGENRSWSLDWLLEIAIQIAQKDPLHVAWFESRIQHIKSYVLEKA